MGFERTIAVRHLRAHRRRSFSIVSWLAVIGVALGVTALVGGFSVTTGFEQAFREKVLGVTAHVFVRDYGLRFGTYRDVMLTAEQTPDVLAASPTTFNEAMFSGPDGTGGAVIKGVIPDRAARVLAIPQYMETGSLDALPGRDRDGLDGVILGAVLAEELGVRTGDPVTIISPRAARGEDDPWRRRAGTPISRTFRVRGVFRAGFQEYDTRLAYMELSTAQGFFNLGDSAFGVEVAVRDPLRAGEVAEALRESLGREAYSIMDWRRQNRNLFASLTYQRFAILVVLSVMVVLASCNVACMLIMLVLERTRDIAILKAMGARNGSVLRIFVMEGLGIGLFGTALGMILAFALCEGLLSNGIALDPKVYGISRLPVVFDPTDYLVAGVGALLITLLAALFPAIRGARLHPVTGLRAVHG